MPHLIPVFFLPLRPEVSWSGTDPYSRAIEIIGAAADDPSADLLESVSTNWWHIRAIESLAACFDLPRIAFLPEAVWVLDKVEAAALASTLENLCTCVRDGRTPSRPVPESEPVIRLEELRAVLRLATEVRTADEESGHMLSLAQLLVSAIGVSRRANSSGHPLLYCQLQP